MGIRRCKRWSSRVFCVIVSSALLGCLFWSHAAHLGIYIYHLSDCNDDDTRVYLDSLCINYANGHETGSLCQTLCQNKDVMSTKCLGKHYVKRHVFRAEWKDTMIIVKTIRPIQRHRIHTQNLKKLQPMRHDPNQIKVAASIDRNPKLTTKEFIRQANLSLYYGIAGGTVTEATERALEQVVSECDLHRDGLLEFNEIMQCWQIAESEEYMIASLLNGNPAVPKVLGVCGELFAMEYATPLDSYEYLGAEVLLSNRRSWILRAKIALAILDLLETLEDTPYGTLYFCDVLEAHIGVDWMGGELVAKAIDLDTSWFGDSEKVVRFQTNVLKHHCEDDSDCEYAACHFACDLTSHTCSDSIISNNLQIVCETIFSKKEWWKPYVLQNPPSGIKRELQKIIHECAYPEHAQRHLPRKLLSQLRSLLQSSI